MNKTEYACHCGSTCVETYDNHWFVCPRCSPICRDKPPDFYPGGDWDFHDVNGFGLVMSRGGCSLVEHAYEQDLRPP